MNDRLLELKKKRNAVILVHNYQPPEVQDIADFLGDSLDLSRKAAETKADVIVFCGVHFMAETAAILSPGKTVLLPDPSSGCPMADMIDAEKLRALKKQHPGAVVVAYVNTSAEVKAESDVCCTSANAVRVVKALKDKEIIFVPDRNLGSYVSSQTGKQMVLYKGFCPTHHKILPEHIEAMRKKYPGAEVLVHPECRPETVALADKVLSTSGMVQYVKTSPAAEFIIGTEAGMVYPLRKQNPGKKFHPACEAAVCPNMKKNSLDKVMRCLEEMKPVVKVEEAVRAKALRALDRMLEYGREE